MMRRLKMNLYQVKDEYLQILDKLMVIDHLDYQTFTDTLCVYKENVQVKAIEIGAYIKDLKYKRSVIEAHICETKDRLFKLDTKIGDLEDYLERALTECDIKTVKGQLFDINIRINPPSVLITDETKIPATYWVSKTVERVDKKHILKDISEGIEIPGADVIRETRLEIK